MRPVDRDAVLRPAFDAEAGSGRLTGQGHGDRHRSAGMEPGFAGHASHNTGHASHNTGHAGHDTGHDTGRRCLDGGHRPSTPRPGWYAYQVARTAELPSFPSWAAEVALTIERPVTSPMEAPDGGLTGDGPEPAGAGGSLRQTHAPQAMLLLRAPGRLRWLDAVAEAIAEVEAVAGIRPAAAEDDAAEGIGRRCGPRLLTGPVLPGLTPVTAAVARAHLRLAGSRGLPAPLRRRQPATGAVEWAWSAGAGCVLTCDGPDGRSAQAVVGLRGMGNAAAITPPHGGAVVLRAWQAGTGWGVACGLVLGAPATLGLGREARRVAAAARTEGWDASVPSGAAAVHLARAGSPGLPAPRGSAQAATGTQVAALIQACLIAGDLARDLDRQPCGGPWTSAVAP